MLRWHVYTVRRAFLASVLLAKWRYNNFHVHNAMPLGSQTLFPVHLHGERDVCNSVDVMILGFYHDYFVLYFNITALLCHGLFYFLLCSCFAPCVVCYTCVL